MAEPEPQTEELEPRGRLTVRAVITRADGTIEDLGVISEGPLSFVAKEGPKE